MSKLFEYIDLIQKFHSNTNHRSNDALNEKFKEEKITWKGISNDINYYIQNCVTCQCKNKSIIKRPHIKQTLFDKPRQRYILDLSELKNSVMLNLVNFTNNNVKELHGLPRKPHSQGAYERVHQTIAKDLMAKILECDIIII